MAYPFESFNFNKNKSVPFTTSSLIRNVRTTFEKFPDFRKKATANNLKYAIEDPTFRTTTNHDKIFAPKPHSTYTLLAARTINYYSYGFAQNPINFLQKN